MKTIQRVMCMGALVAASFGAAAQTYGPKDEGRRFNDGSKVVCKNVEVQRNAKDPIVSPVPPPVRWWVACWATKWAVETARSWRRWPVPLPVALQAATSRDAASRRTATAWSSAAASVSTADSAPL